MGTRISSGEITEKGGYLNKNFKIAIVHDYLTQKGGAEKTVLAMCEAFPSAPVFTSVYSLKKTLSEFGGKDIRVSHLQGWYLLARNHRLFLPFYQAVFTGMDLKGFDVILSSSSSFAKGVKKPKGAIHICYCHNPARFIWMKDAYLKDERLYHLKRLYLALFFKRLKRWDLETVKDVDYFIANSFTVRERIKRFYSREAEVIYPPVDCAKFTVSEKNDNYYLVVSRLLGHKRIDIAIKAFNKLGLRLKIVGTGPHYSTLKNISSGNIEFTGTVEEEVLAALYNRCVALIYPQEEDFGIAPLEANASGKPVIAFAKGGILETMRSSAVFFYNQTPDDIVEAVKKLNSFRFAPAKLRENALRFDKTVFISNLKRKVEEICRHKYP